MNIETYSDESKTKLGNMVLTKHRFYLDTKYWIFMREASLGKATVVQAKIYEKLQTLVRKEVAICPLSPHVFEELMGIGDEDKRLKTAQVMDELSQQVCFISPLNIVEQELLSFVRYCQARGEGKPLFNPAKYVFTKVLFVMGELYPLVDGIPEEEMNSIRINFFDYLSKVTLLEMLKTAQTDFPQRNCKKLITQLNKGKADNQNWKSFHEVFMHEIAGLLEVIKDEIKNLWIYLYENDVKGRVTEEEIRQSDCARLLSNLIFTAFDQYKVKRDLPFLHINASLYAFIRYNKSQLFKENDLVDFSHAAWALPYCNYFFTEKRLHDWICNKPLKLNDIYGTRVLWNEEDVLNTLN